jgi:hypothetical protein
MQPTAGPKRCWVPASLRSIPPSALWVSSPDGMKIDGTGDHNVK